MGRSRPKARKLSRSHFSLTGAGSGIGLQREACPGTVEMQRRGDVQARELAHDCRRLQGWRRKKTEVFATEHRMTVSPRHSARRLHVAGPFASQCSSPRGCRNQLCMTGKGWSDCADMLRVVCGAFSATHGSMRWAPKWNSPRIWLGERSHRTAEDLQKSATIWFNTGARQPAIALSSGEEELYSSVWGLTRMLGPVNVLRELWGQMWEILLFMDASACKSLLLQHGSGGLKQLETKNVWVMKGRQIETHQSCGVMTTRNMFLSEWVFTYDFWWHFLSCLVSQWESPSPWLSQMASTCRPGKLQGRLANVPARAWLFHCVRHLFFFFWRVRRSCSFSASSPLPVCRACLFLFVTILFVAQDTAHHTITWQRSTVLPDALGTHCDGDRSALCPRAERGFNCAVSTHCRHLMMQSQQWSCHLLRCRRHDRPGWKDVSVSVLRAPPSHPRLHQSSTLPTQQCLGSGTGGSDCALFWTRWKIFDVSRKYCANAHRFSAECCAVRCHCCPCLVFLLPWHFKSSEHQKMWVVQNHDRPVEKGKSSWPNGVGHPNPKEWKAHTQKGDCMSPRKRTETAGRTVHWRGLCWRETGRPWCKQLQGWEKAPPVEREAPEESPQKANNTAGWPKRPRARGAWKKKRAVEGWNTFHWGDAAFLRLLRVVLSFASLFPVPFLCRAPWLPFWRCCFSHFLLYSIMTRRSWWPHLDWKRCASNLGTKIMSNYLRWSWITRVVEKCVEVSAIRHSYYFFPITRLLVTCSVQSIEMLLAWAKSESPSPWLWS